MEITQVPKSLTDISIMWRVRPTLTKQKIMTGYAQIIFGSGWKKAAFDVWPGGGRKRWGWGSDGVRAHLSAQPNNTMATAQRCDGMNDGQREGHRDWWGSLQWPA